jgi:hypothetical protein
MIFDSKGEKEIGVFILSSRPNEVTNMLRQDARIVDYTRKSVECRVWIILRRVLRSTWSWEGLARNLTPGHP